MRRSFACISLSRFVSFEASKEAPPSPLLLLLYKLRPVYVHFLFAANATTVILRSAGTVPPVSLSPAYAYTWGLSESRYDRHSLSHSGKIDAIGYGTSGRRLFPKSW